METVPLTSELEEDHPDKVCDKISSAVREACLAKDPETKVECKSFTKTNMVMVFGEVTTKADVNYEKIVQDTCRIIGFKSDDVVLDTDHHKVDVNSIEQQSPPEEKGAPPSPDQNDGITRSISRLPPTHFKIKITSFSSLAENAIEKYESRDFEAGGYKWKLVVHPKGNKNKNAKDHLSLYLSMSDTSSLSSGWEVYAVFRLFLQDQPNNKFLMLQGDMEGERKFSELKLQWGFDQFISLEDFNDASNGYLVDDTCVFGAEVFVKQKNICKGESLSMIKCATSYKHVWKIENFLKLGEKRQDSEEFTAGDHKWKVWLYPKGDTRASGSHVSMFLYLTDFSSVPLGCKIYTNYKLQILDQVHTSHLIITAKNWFSATNSSWGRSKFVEINKLIDLNSDYLCNDVCVVEAEVAVIGISDAL